jgi:hypothetical protein
MLYHLSYIGKLLRKSLLNIYMVYGASQKNNQKSLE